MADEILDKGPGAPLERLERFFTAFIDFFQEQNFTLGCPVGNLSEEMGDLNPAFRRKLRSSLEYMARRIAGIISKKRRKKARCPIPWTPKPRLTLSSRPGTARTFQMKVAKDIKPLRYIAPWCFQPY